MKFQMLIATMALGMCVSHPVERKQRKFVYQEGYPSVRRYPVFPDRLSTMKQSQTLLKMNITKKTENNLLLLDMMGPSIKSTLKPSFKQPEEGLEPTVDFMKQEEPSTDSWLSTEPETTVTTPRSTTRPQPSVFEGVAPLGGASSTLGGFSFTPKPSSLQSSSLSTGPTGPVLSLFEDDPTATHNEAVLDSNLPQIFTGEFEVGENSVFPSAPGTTEDSSRVSRVPVGLEHVSSSSFGVFTEAPEESTDNASTTDLPSEGFTDEERLADPTLIPAEEGLAETTEVSTDAPILEQTATEADWNPATQDINTTEEIEAF